ncbi:M20 family metallopeptidase [Salinarimonas rosea]|uniref:M20 family metallopeptidase n=1 Tax=Salinarimonas rosea TaxID=552063 RepID=UPI0003FCD4EF|nr:M20 family metallopeptidase [Salinarimonas rosea]
MTSDRTPTAGRPDAIARAVAHLDGGAFAATLARLVAMPTESQNPARGAALEAYLAEALGPAFAAMGFEVAIVRHPAGPAPFLIARRREGSDLPTVLGYGHGDVVRGQDAQWREGLSPWTLTERDGAYWGRGTADNKGQHAIDMAALAAVLETRGRLGFNATFLIEMGEEIGSPGLREVARDHADALAADLLVASDGPRLSKERPTLFLGARGGYPIDFVVEAREGAHHSGNFGGLLANPAIELAHALASITGPTGAIRIPEWTPGAVPEAVRRALADIVPAQQPGGPVLDPWWGEPGLTPAERVFAWSSFEILALHAGVPEAPVNAIPGRAWARGQLRFPVGVDPDAVVPALRRHLDANGFSRVAVSRAREEVFPATRTDPDHPAVAFCADSLARTTGAPPAILPNLGGSLPNDVFADLLGMPTVWVPHSYPGCSQHAPNEHLPVSIAREGLALMAGLYWDLGEPDARARLGIR